MLDKLKSPAALVALGAITVVSLILWLFLAWPLLIKFLFILILYILVVGYFEPKFGFFLFLILRPVLDFSTDYKLFSSFGLTLNLAGVFALAFLLFTLGIIFKFGPRLRLAASWPLLWSWLIFLVLAVVSLFWSFSRGSSLAELARLGTFFAAFLAAIILIISKKDLTILIKVIIISAVIPGLVAVWQFFNQGGLIEGNQNRLFGTFAHPNMLAFFLILIITLGIFIGLNLRRERIEAYGYWFLALVLTVILFFTYTRGAYLALAASVFLIGIIKYRRFLIIAIFGLLILYLGSNTIQARINSIFQADPYGSISWRLALWQDEISYIQAKPLTGYGLGLAQPVIAANRDWRLGSTEPHNDFLRVGIDLGLVGIGLYCLLILSLLYQLGKNFYQTQAPRLKMINLFILALALALYAASFGDNILNDSALQLAWWGLLGALLVVQAPTLPRTAGS